MPPKKRTPHVTPKKHISLKPRVHKKHAPYREHKKAVYRPMRAKKTAVVAPPPPPPVAIVVAPPAAAPRTTLPVEVLVAPAAKPAAARKKHTKYVPSKTSKKTRGKSTRPMKPKIVKVVVAARRNARGEPAPPVPRREERYEIPVRVPPPLPVRRAARTTLPVEVVDASQDILDNTLMEARRITAQMQADPSLMQARRLPAAEQLQADPSLMQARRLPAAEQLQAGAAKLKKAAAAAKKVENTMANALAAAMDARRAAIAPVGNDVGGDSDGDAFNDTVVIPSSAASSNIAYALNDPDDAAVVMPGADEMGGAHLTEMMPTDDGGEAMEGTGMVAALGMENE